jgi:hypothetical protein
MNISPRKLMGLSLASLAFVTAETKMQTLTDPTTYVPYKYMITDTNHHHTQLRSSLIISSQIQEFISLLGKAR